jgi:hypothetical protein
MKKLFAFGTVFLLIGLTTTGLANGGDHDRVDTKERFVGAWRLVSLEAPGPDGKIHQADSTGLFVFTSDGHLLVQVMDRNPAVRDPAGPAQYSQGGYEATFGTYQVDESTHTFIFHVEGALVRSLIGKDLPRSFEFSGKQLIVKSTRPEERWRVTWEHY